MTRGGPSYSCKAGVLDYGRKIETESTFSNVDKFGAGGASMFLEQLRRVSQSKFQFRSSGGKFLSCDGEGNSVSAKAESPSTTETFYIERNNNNRVHIQLLSGAYLQATSSFQLTADYPGKPGWDDNMATFEMTIVSNNLHGDYQLANAFGHAKAEEVLTIFHDLLLK
ncbi:hypothetical protein FRX31_026840 [Thalictrum thalictroides]|uniref:DUF7910 domain-containing protein n=1 Tax=Thalictrum thalictroides TaxID=46969 RepID=A0A7J6VFB8_THATH|nr:hypothetical protein FRX31_026840 [Thalictrum thalictroides]